MASSGNHLSYINLTYAEVKETSSQGILVISTCA